MKSTWEYKFNTNREFPNLNEERKMATLKELKAQIDNGIIKKEESVGQTVKVGFMELIVESYHKSYWLLRRGKQLYEFIPHQGIVAL